MENKYYFLFQYLSFYDMDPSANNCFQVEKDDDRRRKRERDNIYKYDDGEMARRKE